MAKFHPSKWPNSWMTIQNTMKQKEDKTKHTNAKNKHNQTWQNNRVTLPMAILLISANKNARPSYGIHVDDISKISFIAFVAPNSPSSRADWQLAVLVQLVWSVPSWLNFTLRTAVIKVLLGISWSWNKDTPVFSESSYSASMLRDLQSHSIS